MQRIPEENRALVFLHTYETPDAYSTEPTNEERLFARIPAVGEYVATSVESDWYRVYLVVHTPFEDSQFDAEVYAVREREHSRVVIDDLRMFE